MKILKYSLKFLLLVVGLFIGILLIISMFTPVYDFDEPQPFAGSKLHNPYEGMDSTAWLQCNFHAHTRLLMGITNGRKNTEERLDSVYQLLGFDHIGISNYNNITYYKSEEKSFIPAYEHGYGFRKLHQLCLGAERVRYIDYPFWQTLSMKQHNINKLGQMCRFVVPAHPSIMDRAYNVEDFKYLSNYQLMEVLNRFARSPEHWDMALSNGHLAYLIAGDDAHSVEDINDPANRFTMINSKENDAEYLFHALESGLAVGVSFPLDVTKTETFDEKAQRLHDNLPYITKVDLKGDTLVVKATKPIHKVEFIGQGGRILCTENQIDEAEYVIQPVDQYVRTILYFADETEIWLNPITRYEGEFTLKSLHLDHLSYWKTAVLWTAYSILIGGLAVFFIRYRKKYRNAAK